MQSDNEILANLGSAVAAFVTRGMRDLSPSIHHKVAARICEGESLCVKITTSAEGGFTAVTTLETQDGSEQSVELFRVVQPGATQETRH